MGCHSLVVFPCIHGGIHLVPSPSPFPSHRDSTVAAAAKSNHLKPSPRSRPLLTTHKSSTHAPCVRFS